MGCFASMSIYAHMHTWCLWGLEEGIGFPGTPITNGYEPKPPFA